MKTPEDEAFEDIERRQGGFQAKRQMAADKLQEPLHIVQSNGKHSPLLTHMMNKQTAPSAQEPVGMLHIERLDKWLDASLKERKQNSWVGLTDEETSGFTQHEMTVAKYVSKVLQEKNT